MTRPATELRASLSSASRTASMDGEQDGASAKQIDLIIALARGSNDFDLTFSDRLTSARASRLIDAMMEAGAVADYGVTEAELDDEEEAKQKADAVAASRKAVRKQKEADKDRRDAEKLAGVAAGSDGRKVRHIAPEGLSLGTGEVVAEDDQTVTAVFPGRRKPAKLLKTVVEFVEA